MARVALVLLALSGCLTSLPSFATDAPELQFRAGTPSDRDGDGIDNAVDGDDDNDLVADEDELPGDTDGDGVPNGFDTDADNDGIADLVEAIDDLSLLARLDANDDGLLDADVELGANGMADLAESAPETGFFTTGRLDSDGDGVPDPYDLDSDNDGLPDVLEAGGSDANGDARVDRFRDFDGDGRDDQLSLFPIVPRDTDGDGRFDFRDIDSDGDGASDRRESSGVDTDGDGVVDGFVDVDRDGLDDRVAAAPVTPIDSDGDHRPDHLDAATTPPGVTVPPVPPAVTPPMTPIMPVPESPNGAASAEGASGAANDGAGRPVTGRAGIALGGCSIAMHGRAGSSPVTDPSLAALALLSLGALGLGARRRRDAVSVAMAALTLGGCASFERPRDGFGIDGYHAGASIGASRLDADLDGTSFVADGRASTSAQLTFGATLAPWLDAELRAADLGSLRFADGGRIGYQVADIGAVMRQRLGPVTWFGRTGIGALFNDGDVEVDRRNAVHLLFGIGADASIDGDWRLRVEASGHDVDALHADVGVVYRFGSVSRGPLATVRAAPSEPAPVPEPVSVPVPEPVPEPVSVPVPEPVLATADAPPPARRGLLIEPVEARRPAVVSIGAEFAVAGDDPTDSRSGVPLPDIEPRPRRFDADVLAASEALSGSSSTAAADRDVDDAPVDGVGYDVTLPGDAVAMGADTAAGEAATDGALLVARAEAFDADDYDIRFERGSDRLSDTARREIAALALALAASPATELAIVTSPALDTDPQSDLLSRRRALAVVRALGEAGVDVARLRPEVRFSPDTANLGQEGSVRLIERDAGGG